MSDGEIKRSVPEETAVDDVRRIRERLHRESGGDIHKHIQESNRVADEYRERLGLKAAQPTAQDR